MSAEDKYKRKRILTNRDFPDGKSWEAIEIDDRGVIFWRASDLGIEACFPVDLEFVKDKFAECGRTLDETKLPPLYKDGANPYL